MFDRDLAQERQRRALDRIDAPLAFAGSFND
jgi:hypothetical protein